MLLQSLSYSADFLSGGRKPLKVNAGRILHSIKKEKPTLNAGFYLENIPELTLNISCVFIDS
jgi:hypothetical protein